MVLRGIWIKRVIKMREGKRVRWLQISVRTSRRAQAHKVKHAVACQWLAHQGDLLAQYVVLEVRAQQLSGSDAVAHTVQQATQPALTGHNALRLGG